MIKLDKLELIWNIDETSLSKGRRWLYRSLKFLIIIIESFTKDNLMNFASALTYSSMMAAVPVLAIVFAVARGFGFGELIEDNVRESLQMNPELTEHVLTFIDSYLQNTHSGVFIGVGLIMLLYIIISLTSNIEVAFNTIWHVGNSRNVYRRFTDYVSVFFLLPIAIIVSSGISLFLMTFKSILPDFQLVSHTIQSLLKITPSFLLTIALMLLYKLMPNTPVKFKYVIIPSILAAAVFQGVQIFYLHFQIKLSSYNAIYGSFAAIPFFMLWLQISWTICLIGARMCYAAQNMEDYVFERSSQHLSRRYRDAICLLLMSRICKRFAAGKSSFSANTLARDTQLPQSLVRLLLEELVQMKLLVSFHNERGTQTHYLPAMDISHMTIDKVLNHIDCMGTESLSRRWQLNTKEWDTLRKYRNAHRNALLVDI
ncbi:MAG: YihY/virulence factor BrkB family protein [Bacteroidaceae bacterium]|nr:YihY/virulence factor BrkB family protein [Bacteroidaceae bacterium]